MVTFLSFSSSSNSSRVRMAIRLAFPAFIVSPRVASATALKGAVGEAKFPHSRGPA
jgi:hypothetical protein